MFIWNSVHHSFQFFLRRNDTGQSEYAPGRIVWMNSHVDVVFVTYRHNGFQEVYQIVKKFFFINVFIQSEEFFYFLHTFRLPAWHYSTVHVIFDAVEHLFRIHAVDGVLAVSKNCRTVVSLTLQLCSCPVKYRHEVVAYHMDVCFAQVFQGFNVSFDIFITFRSSCFNSVAYVYAFDTCKMKTGVFYFFLHCHDLVQSPYFTGHFVIQSGDDSLYIAALTNLFQSYSVVVFAVPAHCHFHNKYLTFDL